MGSLKKEKKGRKQNPGLVSWVMLIKSAAMYSGTIKQNGDRQYRQQCHTHTRRHSHPSLCHRQPFPPCVPTGHSQLHTRLHPVLYTGPQMFKAPAGNFRVFFFFLLASQDAARTPAAGKGELTDTLGCTNLSWCTEGLQAMADLSSGATIAKCGWAGCLDSRVPCRELSSDLIALYHAGQQTGFSCLFLK